MPDVSHVDVFRWLAWGLVLTMIYAVGASIMVAIFGDRRRSPLDRWATWVAFQLKDEDGHPLIKAGTEPSFERKVLSALYYVFVVGVMAWFAMSFLSTR